MKEETMSALNTFIVETVSLLQDASAFAQREIPLVLQEILLWNLWKEITTATALVIIAVGFLAIYTRLIPRLSITSGEKMALYVCCYAVLAGFLSMATHSALEALKVAIAPRLYLIEYAAELTR